MHNFILESYYRNVFSSLFASVEFVGSNRNNTITKSKFDFIDYFPLNSSECLNKHLEIGKGCSNSNKAIDKKMNEHKGFKDYK